MKIAAKFLVLLYITLNTCFASDSDWQKAEDLYRAGDWAKSSEAYKAILDSSPGDNTVAPSLFYNYGTALFRAGSITEAYAVLLKAHFKAPLDSDIRQNLKMAEDKIPDTVKKILPATWYEWWPDDLRIIPTKIWLLVSLLFAALFLWLAGCEKNSKYPALVVTLFFASVCFFSYNQNSVPAAVIVKDSKIRSGPDNKFQEITSVVSGALVNVEEKRENWLKIRYTVEQKETVGWLEAPTVLLLN